MLELIYLAIRFSNFNNCSLAPSKVGRKKLYKSARVDYTQADKRSTRILSKNIHDALKDTYK